jgi:hypothetical protein
MLRGIWREIRYRPQIESQQMCKLQREVRERKEPEAPKLPTPGERHPI